MAISTLESLCHQGHDYHLTIVGDGEMRVALEQRVRLSPYSKNVTLYGRAEHAQVSKIIASHGIVLVTSKFEASPTIVKEAIASKRPVVTTDVGDVSLWVVENSNGYICQHTVQSLSAGVLKASQMIDEGKYLQSINLCEFSEKAIMSKVINEYIN